MQVSFLHNDGNLVRSKPLFALVEDMAYAFLESRNPCLEPCGIAFIVFDMPIEDSPGDTECIAEDVDVVFYGAISSVKNVWPTQQMSGKNVVAPR